MAAYTIPCCQTEWDSPTRTITGEVAPGTASIGIPSGIMLASSLVALSSVSSGLTLVGDWGAGRMSRPMRIRIMPPAILNAAKVMPNILKIKLPTRAKEQRTMAHVHAARRAICRRSESGESDVMARNNGITVKGSTRKNTEVRANSANSRIGVKFMGDRYLAQYNRTKIGTRHGSIFAGKFVALRPRRAPAGYFGEGGAACVDGGEVGTPAAPSDCAS